MPDSPSFVMPTDGSGTREIPLSRGLVAIVDAADYEAVMAAGKWYAAPADRTVYARRNFRHPVHGRRTSGDMHTLIMGCTGVDHRNGDGLDNRRSNLRKATAAQNTWNRRLSSNNRTGYKGVQFYPNKGRWRAQIRVNRRQISLGYHDTIEQAAAAYNEAALEHFGEFARLNTIPAVAA